MVQHTFLDFCWVCGIRFNTAQPPGPATEERHHIIPRAFGGTDGPQVSLCSDHHNKLHRIAECIPKKPYAEWLAGEDPSNLPKLLWLATRVVNARETVRADPNKHVLMSIILDPKLRHQIEQLKPVVGVRSREAVIRYAIQSLFNRNFTTNR